MRIKIEKITFFDFLLTKMSTDKLNITASFLIVYAYVMLKKNSRCSRIPDLIKNMKISIHFLCGLTV